jgi:hypothetical protein
MKCKEIIKIIQDNNLEDFELKVNKLVTRDGGWSFGLESSYVDELVDTDHLDKTVTFSIIED